MDNTLFQATDKMKLKLEKLQLRINSEHNESYLSSVGSFISIKTESPNINSPAKGHGEILQTEEFLKTLQALRSSDLGPKTRPISQGLRPQNDIITPKIEFKGLNSPELRVKLNQRYSSIQKTTNFETIELIESNGSEKAINRQSLDTRKRKNYLETLNNQLINEINCGNIEHEKILIRSNEKVKKLEAENTVKNNSIEKLQKEISLSQRMRDDYLKIIQTQKVEIGKLRKIMASPSIKQEKIKKKITKHNIKFQSLKDDLNFLKNSVSEFLNANIFEKFYKKILSKVNRIAQALKNSTKGLENELTLKEEKILSLEESLSNAYKERFQLQTSSLNFNYKILILNEKLKESESAQTDLKLFYEEQIQKEKLEYERNIEKINKTAAVYKAEMEKYQKEKSVLYEKIEENNQELHKLDEEIAVLNNENINLMQNSITIIEEKLKLENKINYMANEYYRIKETKNIIEANNMELIKEKEDYTLKYNELAKEMQEAKNIINQLEALVEKTQRNLINYENQASIKIIEAEKKLEDAHYNVKELKNQHDIFEDELKEKHEMIENLSIENKAIIENIEKLNKKKIKYLKQSEIHLSQKQVLEKVLADKDKEIQKLKDDINTIYNTLTNENNQLQQENSEKNIEIENLLKNKLILESEVEYLNNRLKEFQQELIKIEQNQLESKKFYEKQIMEQQFITIEYISLYDDNLKQAYEEEINSLQGINERNSKIIKELENLIRDSNKAYEEELQSVRSINENNSRLVKELEKKIKESKKNNEEEVQSLQRINESKSKLINELENALKESKQNNEEEVKSLQSINDSNFKLIKELKTTIKESKNNSEEENKLFQTINERNFKRIEELESAIKELKRTKEEEIKSLQHINDNNFKVIEGLKNETKELKKTKEEEIKSLQIINENNFNVIKEFENYVKRSRGTKEEEIESLKIINDNNFKLIKELES